LFFLSLLSADVPLRNFSLTQSHTTCWSVVLVLDSRIYVLVLVGRSVTFSSSGFHSLCLEIGGSYKNSILEYPPLSMGLKIDH